ncbi:MULTISPECIES: DEAD/DEAH box helicase [Vibrio]|uniref:DEAD/DEAH box helicase n=2 Tax=Vibrio cyclitrophicus TaxID=47951 RepID=A0A7Z1RZV5_9VIBR|nr:MULTISPECIES: DEAD/DEAH box helicase [Vibrio]MBY7659903.1 DEAD/DEAH box helicase [Vibrio atlanticus]KAA8599383.1 ATP-dependent RNA helicase [Vibrio cyclitrophicus]MBE8558962.1 DEAD/DEAH box helicase [Vibrio sp. OPT24]MBE8605638.1 DEAD/DEAH box helicase [Vibrio sp. OPT10]MBU2934117.1 DEAD/DEAH box helicase [Vibrio cyclitrophicus]|tara:strand:+ start:723 stop:1961 length:1239 start_codon:yes stop_codon:yes gene_type:complete
MSFDKLTLNAKTVAAIPSRFNTPTEIQQATVPKIVAGQDVLALAQTGSGKTLAFGLPLLNNINIDLNELQAIIIVPTRELASQVAEALEPIATELSIKTITLSGGVNIDNQQQLLSEKPQLAIATPGRLLAVIQTGELELARCVSLVLDEADRLLDMGFWPDIQSITDALPVKRQSSLFSATLPQELVSQAEALLSHPVKIAAHQENSVVSAIDETLYLVNKGSKAQALLALLNQNDWSQVLVFIGAKDNADALTKRLNKAKISVCALHGNKNQEERTLALESFKNGETRVLIATDVMARGIHIEQLPVVINFDLPAHSATYVHRVGRTARAGSAGVAISLVSHSENECLNAIRSLTNKPLSLQSLEGFPVTDKPASEATARKRPPKDKMANRRTAKKKSVKQFKSKPNHTK